MMPSQCNIDYPVCDSTTPLGIALELGVTEEVEVVDDALCQIPFAACETGTVLGEGTIVTDLDLCNVPTDAVKCEGGNIFDGFYVMAGEMEDQLCNLDLGIPETTTCADTDPLPVSLTQNGINIPDEGITVLDENVCQTSGVVECQNGTSLADAEDIAAGQDVRTFVTAGSLCNAITEMSKNEQEICESCILFGVGGVDGNNANLLITAINNFPPDEEVKTGAWGICAINDDQELRQTWAEVVEGSVGNNSNGDQSNTLFNGCLDAAGFGGTIVDLDDIP